MVTQTVIVEAGTKVLGGSIVEINTGIASRWIVSVYNPGYRFGQCGGLFDTLESAVEAYSSLIASIA